MNILEELKYYCEEPKPVGALMITGEWGCGKTYLLNNMLTDELKDTHIILRVSLFGMESIEEIRTEVKKCWLYAFAESNEKISGIADSVKKLGKPIKTIAEKGTELMPDSLKTIVNGVLSINAIDFVKVDSQMGEKKVVLIFDDLERANISTNDLLGCINDYCENLHINTIVVANEEKIKSNEKDKIKYNEIKEKIIQRTIRYSPDYSTVVSSVIESMICEEDTVSQNYKNFLESNKEIISAFFSDSSEVETDSMEKNYRSAEEREAERQKKRELLKRKPHNIRSLKCAIQDFKRIYCLLDEKQIDKKERWLTSFLAYVLSFRAGLISESGKYGALFSDNNITILYSEFYNDKYITNGIKQWVRHGVWDQNKLDAEFDYIINRDKATAPEEKVRVFELLSLDEKDIEEGYPGFLEKAYNGEIKLEDYENLLYNRCWARKYRITLPDIEWEKIHEGVNKQIKKMVEMGENQPYSRRTIFEEDKEYFLPEEWKVHETIKNFLDENILMFEKNKTLYINLMRKEPLRGLTEMQNKRFNKFDIDMAEATSEGFEKIPNEDKEDFVVYFKKMWQFNISVSDYKAELSKDGFPHLRESLIQFQNKCKEGKKYISEIHVKSLIEVVNNLIDQQKQKSEEESRCLEENS